MATNDEDPRSKRGGHRLFDHSVFPDSEILRVRGKNFIVSSSYLSLHSPYFNDLFHGAKQNGRFELDCDPQVFGDLLDFIYPCYKKTNCCMECTDTFEARMDLAIQLKLKFAERRVLQEDLMVESTNGLRVTRNFPDAVTMSVRGLSILASASTLALHSPKLKDLLYKNGTLVREVDIDVDRKSFYSFMKATKGEFPSELTCQFLDDLIKLGAQQLYDFYLCEVQKRMIGMSADDASKQAKILLKHYGNMANPDQAKMRNAASFVLNDATNIGMVNHPLQIPRNEVEPGRNKNVFTISVKLLSGETYSINCVRGAATTLDEMKILIQQEAGYPPDDQRLMNRGKQLEDCRTLADYQIKHEDQIHLLTRIRGC